jgi:hypothetical protein
MAPRIMNGGHADRTEHGGMSHSGTCGDGAPSLISQIVQCRQHGGAPVSGGVSPGQ